MTVIEDISKQAAYSIMEYGALITVLAAGLLFCSWLVWYLIKRNTSLADKLVTLSDRTISVLSENAAANNKLAEAIREKLLQAN